MLGVTGHLSLVPSPGIEFDEDVVNIRGREEELELKRKEGKIELIS